MNDDYLWDRSGPPDAEVERLEKTLEPLRYRMRTAPDARGVPKVRTRLWPIAAAAAVVLGAIGIAEFALPRAEETAWQAGEIALVRGQSVRTGAKPLRLESQAVGQIDVAPNSEVRATGEKRLELKRGELEAFIWAPAREFVVDTPSARAIDLGCRYTLRVDDHGDGLLKVSLGWVAFDAGGRESFIPAGAECRTRRRSGPGIPSFEDAPAGFRAALAAYENGDSSALPAILREARARDGLTLWHLLTRTHGPDRAAVFHRFEQLVKLPADVNSEGVLQLDTQMIDRCWNALGLENTGWWRGWKRPWGG
jgi:hypothetical protein